MRSIARRTLVHPARRQMDLGDTPVVLSQSSSSSLMVDDVLEAQGVPNVAQAPKDIRRDLLKAVVDGVMNIVDCTTTTSDDDDDDERYWYDYIEEESYDESSLFTNGQHHHHGHQDERRERTRSEDTINLPSLLSQYLVQLDQPVIWRVDGDLLEVPEDDQEDDDGYCSSASSRRDRLDSGFYSFTSSDSTRVRLNSAYDNEARTGVFAFMDDSNNDNEEHDMTPRMTGTKTSEGASSDELERIHQEQQQQETELNHAIHTTEPDINPWNNFNGRNSLQSSTVDSTMMGHETADESNMGDDEESYFPIYADDDETVSTVTNAISDHPSVKTDADQSTTTGIGQETNMTTMDRSHMMMMKSYPPEEPSIFAAPQPPDVFRRNSSWKAARGSRLRTVDESTSAYDAPQFARTLTVQVCEI